MPLSTWASDESFRIDDLTYRVQPRLMAPDLSSRTARALLGTEYKELLAYIHEHLSLMYRRGGRANYWAARVYKKTQRARNQHATKTIGFTDDLEKADGDIFLSYEQAVEIAKSQYEEFVTKGWENSSHIRRSEFPPPMPKPPPYRVVHAICDFVEWQKEKGYLAENCITMAVNYVLPQLGNIPLTELTRATIWEWFTQIPKTVRRVRTAFGLHAPYKGPPRTVEEKRQRQFTANRALDLLSQSLDLAYNTGKFDNNFGWRRIPHFRKTHRARQRHLSPEECTTLIEACSLPLRNLVKMALFTGCRNGELKRLLVSDVFEVRKLLLVAANKGHEERFVALTDRGAEFAGQLAACRNPGEHLLLQSSGRPWGQSTAYVQIQKAALQVGLELPLHITALRHTYATQAMEADVPKSVIAAQLGHTTTITLERHYAHITKNYVRKAVQDRMPDLA